MRHSLVTAEIGSLHGSLRCYNPGEHVRIQFMSDAIPEKFLTGINESVDITNPDTSTQMPQTFLVVVPCRVGLYVAFDMEFVIKLFQEDALHEFPARGILDGVHVPTLGDDAILDDTRVGNQGIDAVAGHHRDRVPVIDGGGSMLFLLGTGNEQ